MKSRLITTAILLVMAEGAERQTVIDELATVIPAIKSVML